MSEIPDDLMAKARTLLNGSCSDVCEFDRGCGCLDDIAAALLSERRETARRCVEICEQAERHAYVAHGAHPMDGYADGCSEEAEAIASRISREFLEGAGG